MTTIHPTAVIDPKAKLGADVSVGPYCVVGPDVTLGDGTRLLGHVFLDGVTELGAGCTVYPFASIGTQTQDLKFAGGRPRVSIGDRTNLREYVTVNAGTSDGEVTRVGNDCHLMAHAHVAHGCVVGNGVIFANCASLAGEVKVEDQATIGGLSGIHQFVRIGRLAFIGGLAKVSQDVPPFVLIDGNPAETRGLNLVGLQRRGVTPEAIHHLKQAYRLLYRQELSTRQALERIRAEVQMVPEVEHLVTFIEASERGITK